LLQEHFADKYVQQAKKTRFTLTCPSFLRLKKFIKKNNFDQTGMNVVDLGGSPEVGHNIAVELVGKLAW